MNCLKSSLSIEQSTNVDTELCSSLAYLPIIETWSQDDTISNE